VKELVFQDRKIKVHDVASSSGISVGRDEKLSVNTYCPINFVPGVPQRF
jgi:hypothetical protein